MVKYLLALSVLATLVGCSSGGTSPSDEEALRKKLDTPMKSPTAGKTSPMKGANPRAPK